MTDWIEHFGGICPVDGSTHVNIKLRNGSIENSRVARELDWRHLPDDEFQDIVAYQLDTPAQID